MIDNQNDVDSPNMIVATPNIPTAVNSTLPTLCAIGQCASAIIIEIAPTAGAARKMPSPEGPTSKTSLAKIGSSAVAPPSSTANRSSEMTPSTIGLWRMQEKPANSALNVRGGRPLANAL